MDSQIKWRAEDMPGDGIDSGGPNDLGAGSTANFVSSEIAPSATEGRNGRLSYIINATIPVAGTSLSDQITMTQDELDQLRQEYIDMGKDRRPPDDIYRAMFVNATTYVNPGHFSFEEINSGGDITIWAIFTIPQNLENVRTYIGNQSMTVTSGYRTPIHNDSLVPPGAPNSQHIYGTAADIALGDFNSDGTVDATDWRERRKALQEVLKRELRSDRYQVMANGDVHVRKVWEKETNVSKQVQTALIELLDKESRFKKQYIDSLVGKGMRLNDAMNEFDKEYR